MTKILKMEFQPIFMSGYTLRKKDKSFWEKRVRPTVVPLESPTCFICGFVAKEKRSLIHADEVWQFPCPPQVILYEVRPLCVYCHEAKDYGNLLRMMKEGTLGAQRASVIQEHYCKINACSVKEFNADYKAAVEEKRMLEMLYGNNCIPKVDYGKWVPPVRSPRLTNKQKELVKALFKGETSIEYDSENEPIGGGIWVRDEPIIVSDKSLKNYCTAVKYLQSLRLDERELIILEMQEYVDAEYDPDFEWVMDHN